ncbi:MULTISPECIES: endonuclease/exonuclease/phosphatase family protein [Brevibacterium]|uniref:Metal-dependent hydrolase, endonuclease/exonuclease/phosphatase family n=2 Tax=Brevibacterium antiquum TaxID=234835 RepID=A0A2H1HM74_9MICO|nr:MULTISPECIES: endonuclease/exonuclease/phosphatase family protein [Brevibacterium]SMX63970.1 Metal-dependent hydrolase, endonuclease/exonuclease/phosphatase family [Brevibacterium antiquum CNRZ 918]SMX64591.1 Metal-dependent hydrolase, endonuclease/exonuclease/phosphatase family [Brevibacterium antiquum]HCG57394.1 endonuclease/exonuclease/phosphatase [Brevibacterium sp.]
MNDFSIMSFNLRYPAMDGHPVARRLPIAAELITEAHPHIIGTQEGELDQLETLISLLPDEYIWLGEGHSGGNSGEFTAVIYDSSRFAVDTVDISWLSEQPETVASESWGVSHARTLTVVDFLDRVTGKSLRQLNTHLDHKSEEARLESGKIMAGHLAETTGPSVVTGDFNVAAGSPVYDYFCTELGLTDTAAVAPSQNIGTFHRYQGPKAGDGRIDWILTTADLRTVSTRINTFCTDGEYPSDHFPVEAVLSYVD